MTPGRVFHVAPAPLPAIAGDHQFRTIGEAAQAVKPGDTVLIHTGVYREGVTAGTGGTASSPIRFELTGWRREPGPDAVHSVPWPFAFLASPTRAHPDDDYHLLIGRAEQVFVSNYALHQVLRRESLSRGDFFADLGGKRLYAWSAGGADRLRLTDCLTRATTRRTSAGAGRRAA